jgi:hypothetical protein
MTVLIACVEDTSVSIRMEGRLPDYSVGPAKFVLPKQATESDPGAAWCYGGS